MPLIFPAFAAGLIFAFGLLVSQMINPAKVLAFLDVFGAWDPSLAVVMGAAVAASALGYFVAKRRGVPVLLQGLRSRRAATWNRACLRVPLSSVSGGGWLASAPVRRSRPCRSGFGRSSSLSGAILLEQNDEWAVSRRYMSLETLAGLCDDPQVSTKAIPAT